MGCWLNSIRMKPMKDKPWNDDPRTVQEALSSVIDYVNKEDEKDPLAVKGVLIILKMSEERTAAALHNPGSYEDNPMLFQMKGMTDQDAWGLMERVKYNMLLGRAVNKDEDEE